MVLVSPKRWEISGHRLKIWNIFSGDIKRLIKIILPLNVPGHRVTFITHLPVGDLIIIGWNEFEDASQLLLTVVFCSQRWHIVQCARRGFCVRVQSFLHRQNICKTFLRVLPTCIFKLLLPPTAVGSEQHMVQKLHCADTPGVQQHLWSQVSSAHTVHPCSDLKGYV